ncbi:MAG: hypothetical protein HC876_02825 [Chloroflexaceae bacterium]|nr:hypothetical protein [Chloroflexaceae bacterium]
MRMLLQEILEKLSALEEQATDDQTLLNRVKSLRTVVEQRLGLRRSRKERRATQAAPGRTPPQE